MKIKKGMFIKYVTTGERFEVTGTCESDEIVFFIDPSNGFELFCWSKDLEDNTNVVIEDGVSEPKPKVKSKNQKLIEQIQNGSGLNRSNFPDGMKGELAKNLWDDGAFSLGYEYGYVARLLESEEVNNRMIT